MKSNALLLFAALFCAGAAQADECFQSAIVSPTPFMGNDGEIFKLADGSAWEVKYEYEYMYEYYPNVLVCPARGKVTLKKKTLNIAFVSPPSRTSTKHTAQPSALSGGWMIYEETNLQGTISGTVKQGSIFKTTSGNVYEVTGATLQLVLELQPDVMVLQSGATYKLVVKGFDEPLICRKLN
jgi:hypothetical protein